VAYEAIHHPAQNHNVAYNYTVSQQSSIDIIQPNAFEVLLYISSNFFEGIFQDRHLVLLQDKSIIQYNSAVFSSKS